MATSMTGYAGKAPKGYNVNYMANYDPQQMELYKSQFQHLGPDSFLSRLAGGDPSMFAETEAPAMRQFSELQGAMGSRFSGMGGLGARNSSGFGNEMNQQASNFAQGLRSQRMELQQQALRDLMGMSNQLLGQQPYERMMEKQTKKPWWQQAIGVGAPLAGAAIGGFFGGPAGAMAGGQIGSSAAQGFHA